MSTLAGSLVVMAALVAAPDGPVKRQRTLVTDAQIAAWRADAGHRERVMKGTPCGFVATHGLRPAATWVEKSDEWLWRLLLPSRIERCVTVGNDNFNPNKLGCPVHGREIWTVNPYYPWVVDCENLPGKLKCPIGGETYPSNDYLAGDLTSGAFADGGQGWSRAGQHYHFLGLYNHYAYNTGVIPAIRSLSRAYTLTGERRYAHKAAVLLLKEATEYPNAADRRALTYLPGYGKGSGMITDVVWSADALIADAYAYDEIVEAVREDRELVAFAKTRVPGLDRIEDVMVYLEEHLFRAGMQALIDARIRPNVGWGQQTMADLALMMNDYGAKHPNTRDAVEWLYYSADGKLKYLGNQFYKDGSSYESTSYNDARQGFIDACRTVARIKAAAPAPYDEARYPDLLRDDKLRRFDSYREALNAVGRYRLCVGDVGTPRDIAAKRPRRGGVVRASEYLDGYGLAVLRDAPDECNATVFYGGLRGHAHYDPLMIGLYAQGRDLLPNIGYPQSWSHAAAWEWSLATHQTVVVDRDEKPCSTVIGSLNVWDVGSPVQVVEAAKRPYRKSEPRGANGPNVTDYRRLTALIGRSDRADDAPYLVDVFRVAGGRDHLQVWRGPFVTKPVAITGTAMQPQQGGTLAGHDVAYGARYKGPDGRERWDPYCHLHTVSRGAMGPVVTATWMPNTEDPVGLRLHYVAQGATELVRATGGAPIAPGQAELQWAFQHRAGSDGLRSQFVTVVEPFGRAAAIREVRGLKAEGADPAGYPPLAVEVRFEGGRDLLLLGGSEAAQVTAEGYRLVGLLGWIRERQGQVVAMHLTAGSLLEAAGRKLVRPDRSSGRIVAVERGRRTVLVSGLAAEPAELSGRRLVVDNHGERRCSYRIEAAARQGEQMRLTLDSEGVLGQGVAVDFADGWLRNGPHVNMPFAGLVKLPDGRLDTSDCFHYGGHLENGEPGVSYRVRGIEGFAYQAWGQLHEAGLNHVHLVDQVPKATLAAAFARQPEWCIYEYGVGDDVWLDRARHWSATP